MNPLVKGEHILSPFNTKQINYAHIKAIDEDVKTVADNFVVKNSCCKANTSDCCNRSSEVVVINSPTIKMEPRAIICQEAKVLDVTERNDVTVLNSQRVNIVEVFENNKAKINKPINLRGLDSLIVNELTKHTVEPKNKNRTPSILLHKIRVAKRNHLQTKQRTEKRVIPSFGDLRSLQGKRIPTLNSSIEDSEGASKEVERNYKKKRKYSRIDYKAHGVKVKDQKQEKQTININ